MSKILTVFGATGNQGGSVIRSVLASKTLSSQYKIRAVTRDKSKPKSQDLQQQGAEVVEADMSNATSVAEAVMGAHAVFAVTNFWEHMSKETEVQQGKSIADASKEAGVKHLIWSGLPHVTKLTNGELKHVQHFDGKAEVSEYIESIKGSDMTATYYMPAFYMSNLLTMANSQEGSSDQLNIFLPLGDEDTTQVPMIDVEQDTGVYVAGILEADPASVNGKSIQGVSEWLTPNQIAQQLSQSTSKQFKYADIPADTFASFLPAAIASELKENMLLIGKYSYYGKGTEKDQEATDKLLNIQSKSSLASWAKTVKQWQ